MHLITKILLASAASLATFSAAALELPDSVYRYHVEATAEVSTGDHAPFWLSNNRFGLSSVRSDFGYLRAGMFREAQYDRRFSWEAGADLAVAYNFTSSFVVQQLYAGVRYRSLSLTAGSREWSSSIIRSELSSGSMTFSQNARPVPQVMLEMRDYNYVPLTKKWLAAKGYISMGMFTDDRWQRSHVGPDGIWTDNLLFHSKGLFLRGGNPDRFPLTVEGGLEMGSQFGGTVYTFDTKGNRVVVHLPHGIKDIIKVIVPMAGGDTNDPIQEGELTNVLGNHVGQWSLAATWHRKDSPWALSVYYQHYFDDHSQMLFDFAWRDMLMGFSLNVPKNPVISEFVYEYLCTKDQSGPVYWDHTPAIPEQVSGRDDYYNHYLYPSWEHWGMGLGNPLLISPIYNSDHTLGFYHNRIKGHHFGFKGSPLRDLDYRVLLSYTRSWGTYKYPTSTVLHNFNALVEATWHPSRLPGWAARISIGADGGRLLGKSFGAMFTISKSGWL